MNSTIAILFKTHIWNDSVEKFVSKIISDLDKKNSNAKLFILMHSDNFQLINEVKSTTIKNYCIQFTKSDIESIYQKGFINMWLSNHWIMMWFWKYNNNFDYVWSIEYDVRITGDTSNIWLMNNSYDFIFVQNSFRTNSKYNNLYTGNKLSADNYRSGFLQLARYSKKTLDYLDNCYREGENGQDEMITFSLINLNKSLTINKSSLVNIIAGQWTWEDKWSSHNNYIYNKLESSNCNKILHPVK